MLSYWPNAELLEEHAKQLPTGMRPNTDPLVVTLKEFLTPQQCEDIYNASAGIPTYHFPGCNSEHTTEYPRPLVKVFDEAVRAVHFINHIVWDFVLDDDPYAWGQSYGPGDSYDLHTDAAAGQTRKLTAVIQLTDPEKYTGGQLILHNFPELMLAPTEQGSIIIFQSWLAHKVLPVNGGRRQTINLGFYGPKFR